MPRTIKRVFDDWSEERIEAELRSAVLALGNHNHVATLVNLSRSVAMIRYTATHILGKAFRFNCLTAPPLQVNDQIGVYFTASLK